MNSHESKLDIYKREQLEKINNLNEIDKLIYLYKEIHHNYMLFQNISNTNLFIERINDNTRITLDDNYYELLEDIARKCYSLCKSINHNLQLLGIVYDNHYRLFADMQDEENYHESNDELKLEEIANEIMNRVVESIQP